MFYFLTSSLLKGRCPVMDDTNDLADEVAYRCQGERHCLFICADPSSLEGNDRFGDTVKAALENAGIRLASYHILDSRNEQDSQELVKGSDLVILAGGHVPTQNAFFRRLGLRDLMGSFRGTLIGISAGTMNCAGIVYAQPELEGESLDGDYLRFLPGLGITQTKIIPHYNDTKDLTLDGKRLFEDITLPDSIGHRFYALCDGSYIMGDGSMEMLCGEAYLIEDGSICRISSPGEKKYI
ncbi:MAG: Type 1 glutamine amidotransferase-like domain-containing protein [Eubacteriaceae bacterium]|nr:Type 1 glutamine amidotransferase-like domain-containing protein [Eubacteriaceae bacterium]